MKAALDNLIGELAQEANPRRRRQMLQAGRQWWSAEAVTHFYDEVVRLLHVDVQQAERIARSAVWLSERIGDDASRAASLRALAHIFYRKRKYEDSVELYQVALATYEKLGLSLEAGRTLNSSLQSLIYLGRYSDAMEYAKRARSIFRRHGDRLRLARLDANMGNILYRQDRFEEALKLYQQSHRAFLEIGQPPDVAISLKN